MENVINQPSIFQAPYAGVWEPELPDEPDTPWPLIQMSATADADLNPGRTADWFGQKPDHCLSRQVHDQILLSEA